MRVLRRRAQKRDQKAAEAQAALDVVAQHTEAGRRAMSTGATPTWAPPQMWSQPPTNSTNWAPPPAEAAAPAPPAPVADLQAELLKVLEVVTRMCDHVIDYIEADRIERRTMVETLTNLTQALQQPAATVVASPPALPPVERVVGGSMPAAPERVIDVRDDHDETAVEVRCLFGDRWVDGFEICEVIKDNGRGIRYRLRRRVDGVVLPELFDAADIRHVETFEELRSTPPQQRHWSPL
jgi:hypothetical protein